MLRWIIGTSLQLRLLVAVAAALLLAIGFSQLRDMPVDVLPEFASPYVEIQTESLGLSAEEVEQLITVPMEQDLLNGLPWLSAIHSESISGLSSVVLHFQPGTDLMRARQMVSERMTQAVAMPHVSKPPTMLQPLSATNRVMIISLTSNTVSQIQLSVLARWTVQPRLMGIPGVANVSIWGQRDRQLQVQVDPKRLTDQNVSLLQVLETTGNALWVSSLSFVEASTPGTGGFIDTANQRLGIRHILPIVSPAELAEVPIEGSNVKLSDVANVVENHQPLIGDALTGSAPGLLLVVEKFPAANTLEVTHGVEEAMGELAPGMIGIAVDTSVFRPADFIDAATTTIGRAALIGIGLLTLVLAGFLFNWRAVLIALLAIPLSLITAALVLYYAGATFNSLVLAGFAAAIGIVVYDSVLNVSHVLRRLQERADTSLVTTAKAILSASLGARTAVLYAALIAIFVVSPVFFMGGTSGAFFKPLAVAYGLAIIASLLVTLTVTPALSLLFFSGKTVTGDSPLLHKVRPRYAELLSPLLRRGWAVAAIVCVLTVAGLAAPLYMTFQPVPSFKELSLLIQVKTMPGTSQPEMSRVVGRMANELRGLEGVRNVGAHVGRAVLGDQVVDVNSAELWVSIDPNTDFAPTAKTIEKVVDGYPGLANSVQPYLREKSGDVIPEPADKVSVRVFGDRYDVLLATANRVKEAIGHVDGIANLRVKSPIKEAALETEVDLAAAQKNGLKPGDVRRAAATLLSGIQVGSLYEQQKVFDVVVWSTPETRHSISTVADLLIDAPGGKRVRLGDVAKVRIVPAVSVIRHDGVKRFIDVIAEVKGRDLDAVAADMNSRLAGLKYPLEYYAKVLTNYALPEAARDQFIVLAIVGAIGAFFLLQAAFKSWRLAAISFLTVPAALVGGLLASLATSGLVISLGTIAGLLAVFGIAVCSGMTLVKHHQRGPTLPPLSDNPAGAPLHARFNSLSRLDGAIQNGDGDMAQPHVLESAAESFGPILTTALATAATLVPILLMGDRPGLEILRPMVIATLGGLATSTLFLLFGVPVLLLLFGPGHGPDLDDLMLTMSDQEIREAMARARFDEHALRSSMPNL